MMLIAEVNEDEEGGGPKASRNPLDTWFRLVWTCSQADSKTFFRLIFPLSLTTGAYY